MADKKISALTGATTPLAGTEVLPIVQSGTTVKVSVDNLTAGKTVLANQIAASGQTAAGAYGTIDVLGASASMTRGIVFSQPVAAGANNGQQIVLRRNGNNEVISSIKFAFNDLSGGLGNYISINTGITDLETLKCDSAQNVTVTSGNLVIGTAGKGISLPGGITWTSGAGSPEGVVTAPVGSLYSRSDGGAGTSLYVKESGSSNTGWVGK